MSKKTHYWIKDFDKMKESDWILKLLSINDVTKDLPKLANNNNVSEVFISNQLLYKHITTDINSIIEKDSISLIKELIQLRERIIDEQSYLEEFKITLNESTFRNFYRGVNIPDLTFNNYGFIEKDTNTSHSGLESTQIQIFDRNIINNITSKSDFMGSDKQNKALEQSIKSSIGWPVIDYKKHAIGSMVDILELALDLVICQKSTNKKIKSVKFLVDIFGLYDSGDGIKIFIEDSFFDIHSEFYVPIWKGSDKEISIERIKLKEDSDDESFSNILNKYLNNYSISNKSGYSETLVLVLYNLFIQMILKLKALFNTIEKRVTYNNNIQLEIILKSIQESIDSLKNLIDFQITSFFDLTNKIEIMSDKDLRPSLDFSKGNSNIFRLIGGVNSITRTENCTRELFPIVLKSSDTSGKNFEINKSQTIKRLIDMFMNPSKISIGGFVLHRQLMPKNCLIIHRYIDKIIQSKINAYKRIDTEFNKMIKSIRLTHIKTLSTHIQTRYKKIMKENNLLLKKAVFNEVLDELLLKYNEFKIKELYILKELIENNKYIKTGERRNTKTLKELVVIQKKLIIEYFTIQNTSFVYSLLLENVYKVLQESLSDKGVNISKVLPSSFIKTMLSKVKEINNKMISNKRSLNTRNIDNLEKKVKRGENVSLNMGGGEGLFNWIKIKDVKNNVKKTDYDKYLKKILESKKLTDSEKALLIRKLFSTKSIIRKKIKKTENSKPVKRPLNKLKNTNKLVIRNEVLDIEYWQDIEEALSGKKIFIPFYQPKTLMSNKGLFDLFYAPFEGELNKESKYIVGLSKTNMLNKLPSEGFMLVCSETNDLENVNSWRLLKKTFIKELKNQTASIIRRKIYGLINSESQYMKNTYVWKDSILKEDKFLIESICKIYHNKLSGCQIIISREELLNYI